MMAATPHSNDSTKSWRIYQNLLQDCIHVIFYYFVFSLQYNHEGNVMLYPEVESFPITSMPDEMNYIGQAELRFLQQYAHCVKFSVDYLLNEKATLVPIRTFLNSCRHRHHRETFQYMKLSSLKMQNSVPAMVFPCGLKRLILKGCTIADFSILDTLRGIESLHIRFGKIIDVSSVEKHFINLRGIKRLWISSSDMILTDQILEHLRGIRNLVILNDWHHSKNAKLTDAGFRNLRGIETLSLSQYPNITDAAFINLRGIQNLSISNAPLITDAVFRHLRGKILQLVIESSPNVHFSADTLSNVKSVQILQWHENSYGGDSTVKHLNEDCMQHLASVRYMNLDGIQTVSNEAFRHLSRNIELTLCGKDDGSYPVMTEEAFSHLQQVKIVTLRLMTLRVNGIRTLIRENMPELESFHVEDCLILKVSLQEEGDDPVWGRFEDEDEEYVYGSFDMRCTLFTPNEC